MSTKTYSKEFRREAVKLVLALEHSPESVSKHLDVPQSILEKWISDYLRAKSEVETTELDTLRRENTRLKKDLDQARKELKFLKVVRQSVKGSTD